MPRGVWIWVFDASHCFCETSVPFFCLAGPLPIYISSLLLSSLFICLPSSFCSPRCFLVILLFCIQLFPWPLFIEEVSAGLYFSFVSSPYPFPSSPVFDLLTSGRTPLSFSRGPPQSPFSCTLFRSRAFSFIISHFVYLLNTSR